MGVFRVELLLNIILSWGYCSGSPPYIFIYSLPHAHIHQCCLRVNTHMFWFFRYLYDGISTTYVESLPLDLMKQYLLKLMLKKYNFNLPNPYNIEGWMSNVKMWPDLNIGHIHQYLLCGQNLSGQSKSVVTVAGEGYETFKLGNVLAVENKQIHGDFPVCLLKAKVKPPKTTVPETYDAWVCLEEMHGTILVSHCTCLTR